MPKSSAALLAGASVGALAVVLARPTNGNGKTSPQENGRVLIGNPDDGGKLQVAGTVTGTTTVKTVSQLTGVKTMKAVFQVLNDDGTQAVDSVTGEPHAFEFPVAPEAYVMIETWMAGQTITNEEGESAPKWTNMGKIAAQFLYQGFKAMAPPEAVADLVAQQQAAEAEKEARFASMFGVSA